MGKLRHNHLMLLSLCLIIGAHSNEFENYSMIAESEAEPIDSNQSMQTLKSLSVKTFEKIEKAQSLEVNDVILMQRSGIKSDAMIQVLISTKSEFKLTTTEVIRLQNEGVSFKVIKYMLGTSAPAEKSSIVEVAAPPQPQQSPVVAPEEKPIIVEAPKAAVTTSQKKDVTYSITLGPIVEQVRMSGTQYAYTKNANATEQGSMPALGEVLTPSFHLDWGITSGLGCHFEERNWTLNTRFDWLSSTATGSYNVVNNQNVIPINIWRDQFLANLNSDLGVAGYGSSNFKVDYFNVNIDLDKTLYIDKNFSLEPHIGLKLSFIYDTVTTTFTGNGSDTSLASTTRLGSNVLTREQKTNFWGVGPSMGVNSGWNIIGGFSLVFEGTGSILVGKSLAKDNVSYSALSNSQTTSWSNNLPTLSPTLQALVGLKYEKAFSNDTQKIAVKLGWDNSFYWNQWNHINTVSESTYATSMDTFQLQEGDTFGLTGLLFNLSWMF